MEQLAGTACCWVMGEMLIAALMVEGKRLVTAWFVVVLEVLVVLDTAVDGVLVVTVVDTVVVWLELDTAELASALLCAWNSAARFLSFKILLWLLRREWCGGLVWEGGKLKG